MTRTWARSPRGKVFGVATGLAEWRDLPADPVRLIVLLAIIFTGVFPGILIYLVLALVLPMQKEDDFVSGNRSHSRKWDHIYKNSDDAQYADTDYKSNEDLKAEYETLKKKVEEMENEMFDKEKDWDERFNSETK